MDQKEKQLITAYHQKFVEHSFDERDVYSFLILVREKVRGNKFIREMGDFIAHREKSRGYVKDYLERNEHILLNLGKIDAVMKIEDVFSFKEIRNGFNSFFLSNGFTKLSNDIINDLILCIISILQDVKLVDEKTKREIGKLSFALSSKEVFLMATIKIPRGDKHVHVQFQALSCNNNFIKINPKDEYDTPLSFSEAIVEVINRNNELVIKFPENKTY